MAFWKKDKKEEKKDKAEKEPAIKDENKSKSESVNRKPEAKEKTPKKKEEKKTAKKNKKTKKPAKKAKKKVFTEHEAKVIDKVLVNPRVSESSMNQQVLGKYVFVVNSKANKNQVKEAVETMYGVTVKRVNVMNQKPENKLFRGYPGKKKGFKKAIVSLKTGDKIDLFSNK